MRYSSLLEQLLPPYLDEQEAVVLSLTVIYRSSVELVAPEMPVVASLLETTVSAFSCKKKTSVPS